MACEDNEMMQTELAGITAQIYPELNNRPQYWGTWWPYE